MKSIKNIITSKFNSTKIFALAGGILIIAPFVPITALAVGDNIAPTISISSPLNGVVVSGNVLISATAADTSTSSSACLVTVFGVPYDVTSLINSHSGGSSIFNGKCGTDMTTIYQGQHNTSVSRLSPYTIPQAGISKVELYVDGTIKSTITSSPFNFIWDSTTVANGTHTILTKAYDLANNKTNSTVLSLITNNATTSPVATTTDNVPPTISLSVASSTNGLFWGKKIKISATATDNVSIKSVKFYLDGKLIKIDKNLPYSFFLKTKKLSPGQHTITAIAVDTSENKSTIASNTFTVTSVKDKNKNDKDKFFKINSKRDHDRDEDEDDDD